MVNERKAPEIRFDGFVDPWEQHGLTDVLSPTVGNNTLSRAELNYDGGKVKNIHYGDVLIKFGSFVDAVNDKIPFITNGTAADFKGHLLQDGDIIFADTAEDEAAGKVVEVINAKETNIVSGLHTIVYRPKRKFADCFMGYYLNTNAYRHQLLPLMQGAKVLALGRNHLATTFVRYPSELDEQATIVDFFRNLDDTIALKKQQHEQTVNIKKSMLEKMFPQKGTDVPEIRFDGFTGAWEVRKLGELGDFKSNGVDKKSNPNELPVNLLNYIDVYNRRRITVANCGKLMQVTAKPNQLSENNVIANDVFFTPTSETSDDIGRAMVIEETLPNTVYSYHLMRYRPFKGAFFSVFPNYVMETEFVRNQMTLVAQGVQRTVISKSSFENIEIYTTSLPEQTAIGSMFYNLEKLITAQCEELEKLQNIKKACLSKMFV